MSQTSAGPRPHADDALARYRRKTGSGSAAVEKTLARAGFGAGAGSVHEDRLKQNYRRPSEPQDGRDVYLTIDLPLQEAIYAIGRAFGGPGRGAVVLDIPTRNVLPMVSFRGGPQRSG